MAHWSAPDLDIFSITTPRGQVGAILGPFMGGLELDPQQATQFVPLTAQAPARLGMPLFAFDTSLLIPAGLPEKRYKIHAITFTATVQSGTFAEIFYDTSVDTHAEIISEITAQQFSAARPMELYGSDFVTTW